MDRKDPHVTVDHPSPNYSSRNGQPIRLIVVHATEASRTLNDDTDLNNLAGWFGDTASQVSSHVATNGRGHSARFVSDSKKAWHVAAYNGGSLGIEQVGHTVDTHWPDAELHETARWIARWSKEYHVPIRKARCWGGRVVIKGVARHSDLGTAGGNHDDPGNGFDLAKCLQLAKHYKHRL